ncbi:MAG: heavy-metal-associated domain-containing protein [Akkermansiaceae bacterium]
MKIIYTLTSLSLLGLSSFASAGESCTSCDTKTVAKTGECCEGTCDTAGTTAKYVVTGMTCESCAGKVKTTLAAVEGVTVQSVCHKSGNVVVKYDPAKTDKSKVQSALVSTGFTVAGEKLDIPVSGMSCGSCSKKVSAALTSLEGCTVGSVCHESGHATVTIDPAKTSEAKVIETINAAGFKASKEEAPAPAKS